MNKLTVDFHSHILPMCDHGSDSLATSLSQISLLSSAGIRTICATPHFYPSLDSIKSFLYRRDQSIAMLKPRLTPDMPKILVGAEVLATTGIDSMPDIESLFLNGTSVLLLEMPLSKWSDALIDTVYSISRLGFSTVIAHADRYPPESSELLFSFGLKAQINVSSLIPHRLRHRILDWIDKGYVAAFGSDIHRSDRRYVSDFIHACEIANEYIPSIQQSSNALIKGALPLI